jgi:hypothetical protein
MNHKRNINSSNSYYIYRNHEIPQDYIKNKRGKKIAGVEKDHEKDITLIMST